MQILEDYAEERDITIGEAMYRVIRYLCDNPSIVNRRLLAALKDVDQDELEEALEALRKDEDRNAF